MKYKGNFNTIPTFSYYFILDTYKGMLYYTYIQTIKYKKIIQQIFNLEIECKKIKLHEYFKLSKLDTAS